MESRIGTLSLGSKIRLRNAKAAKSPYMKIKFPKNAVIFYQGWTKYFHYDSSQPKVVEPKKFFQNNQYFHQRYRLSVKKKKDKHGSFVIPAKEFFYVVLYKDSLSLYSSRDKMVRKHIDSFNVDSIKSIPEDKYLKGGVRDLGRHHPGYCVEARLEVPVSYGSESFYDLTWYFCFNKIKEKAKFLKTLVKLKLLKQRSRGVYATKDKIEADKRNKALSSLVSPAPKNKRKQKPIDGVKVLLQDWSDCTLKCGGGKQYQQWRCIPPRRGGRPCKGKLIYERKCNSQPCPASRALVGTIKSSKPVVKKPIVRIAPYSSRPNRYSKCIIKEDDIYLSNFNKEINRSERLPARIVMNNKTISIFMDDSYIKLHHVFELKQTTFIKDSEFCCFTLRDSLFSQKLCGYDQKCGASGVDIFTPVWEKEFRLFKVDCNVGRQTTLLTVDDERRLHEDSKIRSGQQSIDFSSAKSNSVRSQLERQQQKTILKNFKNTRSTGMRALAKEIELENMIRAEEKQKEELEIANLLKKIEEERQKGNCLDSNIKEKEFDEMFAEDQREADREVQEMKRDVAKRVELKRDELKKKLEGMRAMSRLRKASLRSKLRSMRSKMAAKMISATKVGNMANCRKGLQDADFRVSYCNKAHIKDYVLNQECKALNTFCSNCCEHEFGNLHLDRRTECYAMCESLPKKQVPKKEATRWTWRPIQN